MTYKLIILNTMHRCLSCFCCWSSTQTAGVANRLHLLDFCVSPLHAVYPGHQGCTGEDDPLLRLERHVPSRRSEDHPSGLGGFQHSSTFNRAFITSWLLSSLAPVQQKQQERLAALYQPSLSSGFTVPFVEPCLFNSRQCTGHRLYSATMSAPIGEQKES